jgi:hypothetical protein
MSTVLPIVSIIISIVSLSWAVFVTLRKGDVSRPTLKFYFGFTGPAKKIGKQQLPARRGMNLSTMILVGKLENMETGIFPMHFGVQNSSKTPVKNVQVVLYYPEEFLLRDLSLLARLDYSDKRVIQLRSDANERSVSAIGRLAHAVFEYPLLRPGEGVLTYEPIVFRPSTQSALGSQQSLEELPLKTRMHRSGVAGYFALDVFVTAENSKPTSKRFNVVWLNEEIGDKDANGILERVAQGFWGRFATPGFYAKPWWEKPFSKWEEAAILRLDLAAATHGKRQFKIAEYEPLGLALGKISMPTWNYHEDRRPAHLNRYFSQ